MNNLPWKHINTVIVGFVAGYALTQIAEGYNTVALHWSWNAILQGLAYSGLYTYGLVQKPPGSNGVNK